MTGAEKRAGRRILVLSQYFWPEQMRINDFVAAMQARGHQVTVLTGLPNYPQGVVDPAFKADPTAFSDYHGADVVRVPLLPRGSGKLTLALNYLSFVLFACLLAPWKLRGRCFDGIFVFAVSPITAAIPAIWLGWLKRTPVLLWILDLWPETLSAVGVLRNARLLALVGVMVRWIYRHCDYLLLQSHGFATNVRRYAPDAFAQGRVAYFPSWADAVFGDDVSAKSHILDQPDAFNLVFAGNLGEAQDLPAILDAAAQTQDQPELRWVLVGDGSRAQWARDEIARRGLDNVDMPGAFPAEDMPALFHGASALMVALKPDPVFAMTIPGKVQAYMAAGRPVLGMIDGEAAGVIETARAGLAVPAGDSQGLATAARRLLAMTAAERVQMGAAARAYYLQHFEREQLFDRFEDLIDGQPGEEVLLR
ncbi:MAG: glycosyltransferase family 4 protein [Alcanivoracaceae bacterium]|nr:glycosyltransferase family 4 protein [Alcanivoracaceae bacterium]